MLDSQPLDPVKHKRTHPTSQTKAWTAKTQFDPYFHGRGIFRSANQPGKIGGSDFTIGARYVGGSVIGGATIGKFGGLAVFNRALTDEEMRKLHEAANVGALE